MPPLCAKSGKKEKKGRCFRLYKEKTVKNEKRKKGKQLFDRRGAQGQREGHARGKQYALACGKAYLSLLGLCDGAGGKREEKQRKDEKKADRFGNELHMSLLSLSLGAKAKGGVDGARNKTGKGGRALVQSVRDHQEPLLLLGVALGLPRFHTEVR